jgi:LysR family positive regulator for ilvC
MDFKQLEIFCVLSVELHFSRTARKCHLTSSAVTRTIQRLEEELGVVLLVRSKRHVELTSAGKVFAQYAQSAIKDWHHVKISLESQSTRLTGSLRIYGSVTASYTILSPLLESFRQAFPGVEILMHTGDQADAVSRIQEGHEDVGITARPERLPVGLLFKSLTFTPLRFIMPADHGYIGRRLGQIRGGRGFSFPDIADMPLILPESGLLRDRLDASFRKSGRIPEIYAQVSGHEAIVGMVALGLGIGVVPELVIEHSPWRDKIRVVADAPVIQPFEIGLCASKSGLEKPVVKAFWEVANPSLFTGELSGKE